MMRSTLTAPLAEAAVPVQGNNDTVQGNVVHAPAAVVFATPQAQLEALERLVSLNNEGSSLLRHSLIKGRDAMAVFQTALTVAVDLAESCDHLEAAAEDTAILQEDHQEDLALEDLCRFAPVPIPANSSSTSTAGSDATGSNGAIFYFYNQVVYLNPAGVQQVQQLLQASTNHTNTARGTIRSLSRLYLVVLLLNASLSCYQLGHACLLQPNNTTTGSSYARKARALFAKSLELYAQLTSLTASAFFVNLSSPPTQVLVGYLTLAAANNYTLVCWQENHLAAAQQAQHQLCRLLHQLEEPLPDVLQWIVQEFLLNTTVMTVTAFFGNLAAGAA